MTDTHTTITAPPPPTLNGTGSDPTPGGRYKTTSDGVTPYPAHIGDRTFVFTRRPNAKTQLALTRIRGEQITVEHADTILGCLASMLPEETADRQVDEILGLIDLDEVARLINDAALHLKTKKDPPTTGPSASPSGPTPTASATGSPAPTSTPPTSTG